MNLKSMVSVALFAALVSVPALAQQIIYPASGQSAAQQQKDEGECYAWAKGQTGYDPAQATQYVAPPPPQQSTGGERVQGAARGALGGVAIGAIAGNAGKGAAIGAVAGTMVGGSNQGLGGALDGTNALTVTGNTQGAAAPIAKIGQGAVNLNFVPASASTVNTVGSLSLAGLVSSAGAAANGVVIQQVTTTTTPAVAP